MKRPKMIIVSKDGKKVSKKQFKKDMKALGSMAKFMSDLTMTGAEQDEGGRK